jgi:hypothetical protein
MSDPYIPGPGDEATWGRCTGHEHDPRTETIEEFWSVCVDDEVFDEAEDRAAAELRRPTLITVKRVGRYPEIVRHRFEQEK